MEEMTIFADESGTTAGSQTYTIGLLNIPTDFIDEFNSTIEALHRRYGMNGEIKWEKVRKSAGQVNLCLNILKFVLDSPCAFHAIAVYKQPYRKWHDNQEDGFFTTYNLLLKRCCAHFNCKHKVFIDQLSTSYGKQDEVMQIITNHMLSKLPTSSTVEKVEMENSKLIYGLQAADILTGAVNSSYNLYYDESAQMQPAKKMAIDKMSSLIGWNSLQYDTYPNKNFNIWHFPPETRAIPSTEEVVIDMGVEDVSRFEFEAFHAALS